MSSFASYAFNKSHAACYAYVAFQTAYLKCHYPVQFMAAILNGEIESAERIAFMINTCKEMGINVLPPDVNSSDIRFSTDNGNIRFGLGAIKGVGEVAASQIIESRQKDGKFETFLDFCERCGSNVNSRMLEHLTRAGAPGRSVCTQRPCTMHRIRRRPCASAPHRISHVHACKRPARAGLSTFT